MQQHPIALLSVSDKSGLQDFAQALVNEMQYRVVSTGGTARMLKEAGIPVTEVSEYTGFPELMQGRIKTLHPKIHGGILCDRENSEHANQAQEHGIEMIDLVAINLYPFEDTIARPGIQPEEAIENIDIGGPSMIRSAAKNHKNVTVVCDPKDYPRVLEHLRSKNDLHPLRQELAQKAFERTAAYDTAISAYLNTQTTEPDLQQLSGFPKNYELKRPLAKNLRYGENPHQQAALYGDFLDHFRQLQGKELSFNNIMDISAATYLIGEFEPTTVAILKHMNPCGVANGSTLHEAWKKAFSTDTQAPFGGIIVVNRTLDEETAKAISEIFCEVIIAPSFSEGALEWFAKKKNLRLLEASGSLGTETLHDLRSVPAGLLVQDRDKKSVRPQEYKVVTDRQPTEKEWNDLLLGWRVVKHVKSNAIVYAGNEQTLGIGAGQMSRVDSSRIAVWKAGEAGLPLENSIVASDAFFPFADGLVAASDAGATAAIQPGGSNRDQEVIQAANERSMAMVFTGTRHFRH